MNKKKAYDSRYMRMAYIIAEASHARKKKVGCLIVKGTTIISDGFNGMPSGMANDCEIPNYCRSLAYPDEKLDRLDFMTEKEWLEYDMEQIKGAVCHIPISYTTKIEVLHAESNALMKLARSTQSSVGATLYTTLSPCIECSKLIIQADIGLVIYDEDYKDNPGLQLLERAGIPFEKINLK